MSLINKVLRDLDSRQPATSSSPSASAEVRVVAAKSGGHEWFWRTVSLLVLIALGWVGWVFYQIQPRPITTELAQEAAERATKPAIPVAKAPTPPPAPAVQKPATETVAPPPAQPPTPVAQKPAPAPAPVAAAPVASPNPSPSAPVPATKPAAAPDLLRFAYSIETPIGAPKPRTEAPKANAEAASKPKAEAKRKTVAQKPRVERRDVALSPADRADGEFRRGVDLLKRGRATEAEAAFAAALRADPKNRGARQAMVALKLERGELDEASRLLEEALVADPAQPEFAVALARIHVERNKPQAALTVLDDAAAGAGNFAEYHFLRGAVLQRLGRHVEAADAYRAALRVQATLPQAWMGLGISLEALAQRKAAADAFRNALAAGPVSSELRTFAEQRIQALR